MSTIAAARDWQREANRLAEGGVPTAGETQATQVEDQADQSEKLFWWAFCYVALGFLGVALALFASDIAG